MTDAQSSRRTVRGELLEPGHLRLEDSENSDAWIEATYRDGWVGRKLLNADDDAYAEMVHPYLYQCIMCREWMDTQLWGLESPHCPHCEQFMEFEFPRLMAWLFDGESLEREVMVI